MLLHVHFYTDLRTTKTGAAAQILELENFHPDILAPIIGFIYTSEIRLSTDNMQSIHSARDELQLDELKEGCDELMSQRV